MSLFLADNKICRLFNSRLSPTSHVSGKPNAYVVPVVKLWRRVTTNILAKRSITKDNKNNKIIKYQIINNWKNNNNNKYQNTIQESQLSPTECGQYVQLVTKCTCAVSVISYVKRGVWPPHSADTVCDRPPLMTLLEHFVSQIKKGQRWDVQTMWAYDLDLWLWRSPRLSVREYQVQNS